MTGGEILEAGQNFGRAIDLVDPSVGSEGCMWPVLPSRC